jgi:hypothetical protein
MSTRSYRIMLAVLGVLSLLLVPFLVQGLLPATLGTVAFVVVIAWIVYGAVNSKLTHRSGQK